MKKSLPYGKNNTLPCFVNGKISGGREEGRPRLNTLGGDPVQPQYDLPDLSRLNTRRVPGSTGQAGQAAGQGGLGTEER